MLKMGVNHPFSPMVGYVMHEWAQNGCIPYVYPSPFGGGGGGGYLWAVKTNPSVSDGGGSSTSNTGYGIGDLLDTRIIDITQSWCPVGDLVTVISPDSLVWDYNIGQPMKTFTVTPYDHVEVCSDYKIWYNLTGIFPDYQTIITPDLISVPPKFTIFSVNNTDIGNYTAVLTGINPSEQHWFQNITFRVMNPCLETVVTGSAVPAQSYTITQPTYSITLPSFSIGNVNCQISYSITLSDGVTPVDTTLIAFNASTQLMSIQSNDNLKVGDYSLSYNGWATWGLPGVLTKSLFTLTIYHECTLATIQSSNIFPNPYYYDINPGSTKIITSLAWPVTSGLNCPNLTYSWTLSDGFTFPDASIFGPSFLGINSFNLSVGTTSPTKIGTYNFQISGTLKSGALIYKQAIINFQVIVQTSCLFGEITPLHMSDIVYYTGSSLQSYSFQEWTHNIALCNPVTYTSDLPLETGSVSLDTLGFINFNSYKREYLISTNEVPLQPEFSIRLNGTARDQSSFILIRVAIRKGNLYAPSFKTMLKSVSIEAQDEKMITLPEIQDLDGDSWHPPKVNFGKVTFASGNFPTFTLKPQLINLGEYKVSLILTDYQLDKAIKPKSANYSFQITVLIKNQTNNHSSDYFNIYSIRDQSLKPSSRMKVTGPLEAKLTNISPVGIVTVEFNQDVIVPLDYPNLINEKTIQIYLEPSYIQEYSQFSWKVISFNVEAMTIQLNFTNPLLVAKEQITLARIKFLKTGLFTSNWTGNTINAYYTTNSIRIPRQMKLNGIKFYVKLYIDASIALIKSSYYVNIVVGTSFFGTFMFNLVMQGFRFIIQLGLLQCSSCGEWLMKCRFFVQHLYLIFHFQRTHNTDSALSQKSQTLTFYQLQVYSLLSLTFLRNLWKVEDLSQFKTFSLIKNRAQLKLWLELISFKGKISIDFDFSQPCKRNDGNFIQNIGSNFIYAMGFAFLYLLMVPIKWLSKKNERCLKLQKWLGHFLYYGGILRFLIQGYLQFCICSMANIFILIWNDASDVTDAILTIFAIVFILIFPIAAFVILKKNFGKLQELEFKKKFESLFEGTRTTYIQSIYLMLLFFMRRFWFAFTCIILSNQPLMQIMMFFIQSQMMLIFLIQARPYETHLMNNLEIFNELCILATGYHLIIFTDFVVEDEVTYLGGWSLIFLLAINFIGNMITILVLGVRQIVVRLPRLLARIKNIESIKKCLKILNRKEAIILQKENFTKIAEIPVFVEDFEEEAKCPEKQDYQEKFQILRYRSKVKDPQIIKRERQGKFLNLERNCYVHNLAGFAEETYTQDRQINLQDLRREIFSDELISPQMPSQSQMIKQTQKRIDLNPNQPELQKINSGPQFQFQQQQIKVKVQNFQIDLSSFPQSNLNPVILAPTLTGKNTVQKLASTIQNDQPNFDKEQNGESSF